MVWSIIVIVGGIVFCIVYLEIQIRKSKKLLKELEEKYE